MISFISPLFTCGKIILVRALVRRKAEKKEGNKRRQYVSEEKKGGKSHVCYLLHQNTKASFFPLSFVTENSSEEVFECASRAPGESERESARA